MSQRGGCHHAAAVSCGVCHHTAAPHCASLGWGSTTLRFACMVLLALRAFCLSEAGSALRAPHCASLVWCYLHCVRVASPRLLKECFFNTNTLSSPHSLSGFSANCSPHFAQLTKNPQKYNFFAYIIQYLCAKVRFCCKGLGDRGLGRGLRPRGRTTPAFGHPSGPPRPPATPPKEGNGGECRGTGAVCGRDGAVRGTPRIDWRNTLRVLMGVRCAQKSEKIFIENQRKPEKIWGGGGFTSAKP